MNKSSKVLRCFTIILPIPLVSTVYPQFSYYVGIQFLLNSKSYWPSDQSDTHDEKQVFD
jgi:hypothetical protein